MKCAVRVAVAALLLANLAVSAIPTAFAEKIYWLNETGSTHNSSRLIRYEGPKNTIQQLAISRLPQPAESYQRPAQEILQQYNRMVPTYRPAEDEETYSSGSLQEDFDPNWDSVRTFHLTRTLNKPLKVYVETHPQETRLYKKQYPVFVKESLDEWSNALGGRLKYELVQNPGNANITVRWVAGFADKDQAGETSFSVGHAAIEIKTVKLPDQIIKADIMHEIGHALGISGHSPHNDDIMRSGRDWKSADEYFNYKAKLSRNDIEAIRLLYSNQWQRGQDLYAAVTTQGRKVASATTGHMHSHNHTVNGSGAKAATRQPEINSSTPHEEQYLEGVNEKVKTHFIRPAASLGNGVKVSLNVDKDGHLRGYQIKQSSGDADIDQAVVQAIENAAPYAPIPNQLKRNQVRTEMSFN